MKLTVHAIEVPPPGVRNKKGIGWSKLRIHLVMKSSARFRR